KMRALIILPSTIAFLLLFSTACSRRANLSGALDQQLLAAVEKKNTALAQQLLRDGAHTESKDANGDTPLILATENADLPTMKLLLQNNANVEAKGNGEETALVNAARGDDVDVVKTLLEKVSDKHDQEQALLAASMSGPVGVLEISSDLHSNKPNPLPQIKEMPEVGIVRLLLDRNISIETRDYDGNTPLILAASFGQIEITQFLLDRGAQVDVRDNEGYTALNFAACACAQATMRPTYDILNLLLDRGAKIDTQSNDGTTALMSAALGFEIENAELLIKRGANLRIKNKKGKTALQLAVENKNTRAVQVLKTALAAR